MAMVTAGSILGLAGCAAPALSSPAPSTHLGPTASAQSSLIPGTRSDGASYSILVTDYSGWLLGADASPTDRPAGVDFNPDVPLDNLTGDPRVLFATWMGGLCDVGQALVLTAANGRLGLDLNTGYLAPPEGEACPAVGLGYRVRLAFSRDVPAADVLLTVRGVDSAHG